MYIDLKYANEEDRNILLQFWSKHSLAPHKISLKLAQWCVHLVNVSPFNVFIFFGKSYNNSLLVVLRAKLSLKIDKGLMLLLMSQNCVSKINQPASCTFNIETGALYAMMRYYWHSKPMFWIFTTWIMHRKPFSSCGKVFLCIIHTWICCVKNAIPEVWHNHIQLHSFRWYLLLCPRWLSCQWENMNIYIYMKFHYKL